MTIAGYDLSGLFDVSTVKQITDLTAAYKDFGWQFVQVLFLVIFAISVIQMIYGMLQKARMAQRRVGKRFGMLQVNRSIKYERKKSLARRRSLGLWLDKSDDGTTIDSNDPAEVAVAAIEKKVAAADGKTAATEHDQPCCADATSVDVKKLKADAMASTKPVAVIMITNDMMASQRDFFAKCVSEVIQNRQKFSRVIIAGSSPGGAAPMYGQMYHEMERLRTCSGLHVQWVADWCAASGGYMQAVAAHEILAPRTAIIGSIGVVANIMNYRQLGERLGIKFLEYTAGEFKRTVSATAEITPEKEAHFKEDLARIHAQFIAMVKKYRPQLDEKKVCNGAHWNGEDALALGLIDGFSSSQELLFEANQKNDLIFLTENVNPFEKGIFRFLVRVTTRALQSVSNDSPFGRLD